MKKKILVILFLIIFIISGCSNKEELTEQATTKVNTNIKDITNITEKNIKESYTYIKENYKNHKDDAIYEELIYHLKYLELLGQYSKDNKLTELSTKVQTYIKKDNKSNKEAVAILLNNIDGDEDKLIKELYTNYLTLKTINTKIEEQTPIVEGDINDPNMLTISNITKAVDYLISHIQKPLKNDEVLEKTIYYSLFLSKLGKEDNELTLLANNTLEYLKTLDSEKQEEIIKLLNNITKNQDKLINDYYKYINSN